MVAETASEHEAPTKPRRRRFSDRLSPLNQRRWSNFRANKRGFYSLWIFLALYLMSLCAELIANDKPFLLSYRGEIYSPVFNDYNEVDFGGEFFANIEDYNSSSIQCLIYSGGLEDCYYTASETLEQVRSDPDFEDKGWMLWPLLTWSHDTPNNARDRFPAPPNADNLLGTDVAGRDVLARTIYAFRISVSFGLIVTLFATIIGVLAGAVQGFFGGLVDLIFQRIIEIWTSAPYLFVILILSSVFSPSFWILTIITCLFTWTAFVGVVRAEFLRARNFEYVRAAEALGLSSWRVMTRHVLPNALVATVTLLPFVLTGAIGTLAGLDFLGFGLGSEYPSLGKFALEAKDNLQAPWLAFVAFFTFAIMLMLLVFVFEAVRDAFDPRKTFA